MTAGARTILVLGWARLANRAREGSGYNLVASAQATGLAERGHRVCYLRSGMEFTVAPRGPFVRFRERWGGVTCYDLVNSCCLAPASANFRNMREELGGEQTIAVLVKWARREAGDGAVVLAHSLEGLPLGAIAALREAGLTVIVTPHNYWYGCPQVDLLRHERELCLDYEGGASCVGCLNAPKPGRAKRKRSLIQLSASVIGMEATGALKHGLWAAGHTLRGHTLPGDRPYDPSEDPEVATGRDVFAQLEPRPLDANERMLDSAREHRACARDPVARAYGERRRAGMAALDAASVITPPSDFVGQSYAAMGVDPKHVRTVRLGLPHLDAIRQTVERSGAPAKMPWTPEDARPLCLAFFGTTRAHKGLSVLAGAIESLTEGVSRRVRFQIHAAGEMGPWRRRFVSRANVALSGAYEPEDLAGFALGYDAVVLPHAWFENSPVVMLEQLHAGKLLLASRLGGPVEWLREHTDDAPGNALLVPGADAPSLASAISRLVRGEVTLPSAEQVWSVTPHLRTYREHLDEVEGLCVGHANLG
ncbi:MAG: glycosyltransferase [Planctomycetota bacterium]